MEIITSSLTSYLQRSQAIQRPTEGANVTYLKKEKPNTNGKPLKACIYTLLRRLTVFMVLSQKLPSASAQLPNSVSTKYEIGTIPNDPCDTVGSVIDTFVSSSTQLDIGLGGHTKSIKFVLSGSRTKGCLDQPIAFFEFYQKAHTSSNPVRKFSWNFKHIVMVDEIPRSMVDVSAIKLSAGFVHVVIKAVKVLDQSDPGIPFIMRFMNASPYS